MASGSRKPGRIFHKGDFFKDPAIAFGRGDIEGVLRQLTVTFEPGSAKGVVSFDRLSDGQKSLLYISLVLAWQGIARSVLTGTEKAFDPDKLRPPVHIVLALEEPENSLAPQYLGRIVRQLREACGKGDVQGVVATHAPALLHRVPPEDIRFLRLTADRTAAVHTILMPAKTDDEAAKYVREAVLAHPELYFARLVVLGEGDSEQIVLPRVLAAAGIAEDDVSVCVVSLGGRHVNHFWRLLERLEIPSSRFSTSTVGGIRRAGAGVSYAAKQLNTYRPGTFKHEEIAEIPAWSADRDFPRFGDESWLLALEKLGVFFSYPLDLDLMLLEAYPNAYNATTATPSEATEKAVLGKARANVNRLDDAHLELFDEYQKQFKQGSKPASHIAAMAELTDEELLADLPEPLKRMLDAIRERLESIPE